MAFTSQTTIAPPTPLATPCEGDSFAETTTATTTLTTHPAGAESLTDALPWERQRSLLFQVGGQIYMCDVQEVREIFPLRRVTPYPGAPSAILGLVNVRGTVVTVVDGGLVLHGVPCPRDRATVMLVDVGTRGVGLAVDLVTDSRVVREDEGYQRLDVRDTVSRVVMLTEER